MPGSRGGAQRGYPQHPIEQHVVDVSSRTPHLTQEPSQKGHSGVECLVGGATVFGIGTNPYTLAQHSANTTGFAVALGGTPDIRMNHMIDLRPFSWITS